MDNFIYFVTRRSMEHIATRSQPGIKTCTSLVQLLIKRADW